MIVEELFCNIKCDCCGEILDNALWLPKGQKEFLDTFLKGSNWIEVDGKHYCPNCYSYDNNDSLVINKQK